MEKEVKRGYVKWTDEDGVFHKEPLYDHPELLAKASDNEKEYARQLKEMNNPEETPEVPVEEEVEEIPELRIAQPDPSFYDRSPAHTKPLEELREETAEL